MCKVIKPDKAITEPRKQTVAMDGDFDKELESDPNVRLFNE